jgi:ribonuclease PH
MINLEKLGERSITIDCDVLQADGGTRTASITGGCVALSLALEKLAKENKISAATWLDTVSAISVGMKDGNVLVDLDYEEDSSADVDMNFVVKVKDQFVEVQGTAEGQTFSKAEMDQMAQAAFQATQRLRELQLDAIRSAGAKLIFS